MVKLTALDRAAKKDFDDRLWGNIEKQLVKYMENRDIGTQVRRSQDRAATGRGPRGAPAGVGFHPGLDFS